MERAELHVEELMHRGVVTCVPSLRLGDVAALLAEHRVHAVFVEGASGTPAGVVSDMDLLSGEWLSGDDKSFETMRALTAADIMSAPIATIPSTAHAAAAAERMRSERLSRLLVLDETGAAKGVLAVSDLVESLIALPSSRERVADVMSRGFVAARPEASVVDLARAMTERRSRSVVILEPNGGLAGVVSGIALLAMLADSRSLSALTAADLMEPPQTIAPEASLQDAADEMLRHEVHRLLVTDPGTRVPLGIISTADITVAMAAPGSRWRGG